MLNKKESDRAARASIKRELAKPRVAKSARMAELMNFAAEEVPGQAGTRLTGTVKKIIASLRPAQPGTAQIAVAGADDRYRNLRIKNSLTNGNGDEVRLKMGARVRITVTAKSKK